MTPRIVIRDAADALTICAALQALATNRISEYTRAAGQPGADQFALTAEMTDELRRLTSLMTAVGDSTIPTTEQES